MWLVVDEASFGDPQAARERLAFLEGMILLQVTNEAEGLAHAIVSDGVLPDRAFPDALHIGIAAVYEVDYLLTWNCAHIANAEILPQVGKTCRALGFAMPFICTPDELMGDEI